MGYSARALCDWCHDSCGELRAQLQASNARFAALLTDKIVSSVADSLPLSLRAGYIGAPLFNSSHHGMALSTLSERCGNRAGPADSRGFILLVTTTKREQFGAFFDEALGISKQAKGSRS